MALANSWRRQILDELRSGPRPTAELAQALGADQHQMVAHLQVLRTAGLVIVEKQGRQRLNYLDPVPIGQIYQRWVSAYEQSWTVTLVGLKRTVEHRDTYGGEHVG